MIRSNFSLINLQGLENLFTVKGDVWFYNNSLRNFNGLTNLHSIGGSLTISQNYKLQNVDAIAELTNIGENLGIMSNDSIISLQGFQSLKMIGGYLDIHYNDEIKNLVGIDNIDSIGGNLSIYANDSLAFCSVGGICRYIANPNGSINIHDNTVGCNSKEEIKEDCDSLSIPENYSLQKWIISPNPVINKFTINLKNGDEARNVFIYNQLGCTVLIINQVNGPIDISKLEKGLYLIEFAINGKLVREQIVKL